MVTKRPWWALVGLLLLSPLGAQETEQDRKAAELAGRYGVPLQDVVDMRAKGLGWGEVRHALDISERSGKPLSEIMAQRDSGMGWGEIAKKHGVSLGPVKGRSPERLRDAPHDPKRGRLERGRVDRDVRRGRGRGKR
ncbi:MAG: hypothetical protein HY553_19430 [Elusimicrobia bacterium]|nr:hypothetical protein [Elusimicrobiota bacterium]